jgi:hypothetical protein
MHASRQANVAPPMQQSWVRPEVCNGYSAAKTCEPKSRSFLARPCDSAPGEGAAPHGARARLFPTVCTSNAWAGGYAHSVTHSHSSPLAWPHPPAAEGRHGTQSRRVCGALQVTRPPTIPAASDMRVLDPYMRKIRRRSPRRCAGLRPPPARAGRSRPTAAHTTPLAVTRGTCVE